MTDFSELFKYVKKLLPTNGIWLHTTITLGITIVISSLPGYLKELWPDMHIPEILLFQVALIFTTLFLGSFILIIWLIRHIQGLHDKADLEKKLTLINKYHELNEISWAMIENEVSKNETFNIGKEKARKSHEHP